MWEGTTRTHFRKVISPEFSDGGAESQLGASPCPLDVTERPPQ